MLVETADALSERGDYVDSEKRIREALLIGETAFEEDSEDHARLLSKLGGCLLRQEKFPEAEIPLRRCVAIREKKLAETWLRAEAVSALGASLLGQKMHVEAGPLLLAGYEGLKRREATVPVETIRDALERVVQFYEATREPSNAAEWKQKLDAFNARSSGRPR